MKNEFQNILSIFVGIAEIKGERTGKGILKATNVDE